MRSRRTLLVVLLAAGAASGCSHDGGAGVDTQLADGAGERVILVESLYSPRWPADPITITGVAIERDSIRIAVTYGGGCREHRLGLIVSTAWMESWPVQAAALVVHDARGDLCRAIVSDTVRADLTPLRDAYRRSYQSRSGRIALRIAGSVYPALYVF
jgi:hypothetical protein